MNIKEYISAGYVESYVLGLATEEEKSEFERLCALYPEVAAAKEAFELSLEKLALQDAVPPPLEIRDRIKKTLRPGEPEGAHIIRMVDELVPVRSLNWLKVAAVACLVLLVGSIYWNIFLYHKNRQLQASNAKLEVDVNSYAAKLSEIRNDAQVMKNPNVKMATLKGTQHSPASFATVYWDTASRDVYLMVNNLPQPASDKQYQLWAILNGTPIDLGMLEIKQDKLIPMFRMKNAQNVQAFAITLEKKGGNPTPTMEEMYVIGEL